MNDLISIGVEAAKEAGHYLRENFNKADLQIERKVDHSLATNIDKESERLIVDRIRRHFPGHGVIGEERGLDGGERDFMWIIDPLDGTHNYIRGIPLFGVSIGVAYRDQFVAGIIYLPMEGLLYIGEHGNGAYCNGESIRVSTQTDLSESTISFDSSLSHQPEVKLPLLGALAARTFNLRMFGASVRVLTFLAEGHLDATVEIDDQCWDYAAGACIIEAAGGKATDLMGNPLNYRAKGYIASNGLVHQAVLAIAQSHLSHLVSVG
jgi:myo-inositol-1(or 4)-monophosphatase